MYLVALSVEEHLRHLGKCPGFARLVNAVHVTPLPQPDRAVL